MLIPTLIHRLRTIGVELIVGSNAIIYGISALSPGPQLMYRLGQESGYPRVLAVTMIASGFLLCGGAVRSYLFECGSRRFNRRARVAGAFGANFAWAYIARHCIENRYWGLLFACLVFFAFGCLISLSRWER